MSLFALYGLLGLGLFVAAIAAFVSRGAPLFRLLALNVASGGVFLIYVAFSARTQPADPIFQAMVLTGIVVSVCFTAMGALLIRALYKRTTL
ncbi:MAG: NADH-quinone oxidoreductase subunit K [Campylobacterales bacterium]